MDDVLLGSFDNSHYSPGRSLLWQMVWFFIGLPILRSPFNVSSSFKAALLRVFGARVGTGVVIKPGVRVKYPWRLTIGNDCWIGEDCWLDNLDHITVSSNVCVSQGVYFCTGNHDWSDPSFGLKTAPIVLKDGAWAAARSTLLPGVQLGRCSVAGAGSVVSKSIPDYEVHVGNPARFVRNRSFSVSQQEIAVGGSSC